MKVSVSSSLRTSARRTGVAAVAFATVLASTVVGVTGAEAAPATGTCLTFGSYTSQGTTTSCTVEPGETIRWVVKGGNGGNPRSDSAPAAGRGAGAKITGDYTNATGSTVTLTIRLGQSGRVTTPAESGYRGGDGGGFTSIATSPLYNVADALVIAGGGGGLGTAFKVAGDADPSFSGGAGAGGDVKELGFTSDAGNPGSPGGRGGTPGAGGNSQMVYNADGGSGGAPGVAGVAGAIVPDATGVNGDLLSGAGGDGYRAGGNLRNDGPVTGPLGSSDLLGGAGGNGYAGGGGGAAGASWSGGLGGARGISSGGGGSSLVRVGATALSTTATEAPFVTIGAVPSVTSISPASGTTVGGTAVTVTGTGFLSGATVRIGGVTCTGPTVVSSTQITCTTGAKAPGVTDVVVTNTNTFSDTGTGLFTYAAPTVTAISPGSGPSSGGTSVTVTGTYFAPGATVSVGGAACAVVGTVAVDATSITCTTSARASGVVNVVVRNTDTRTGTGALLFQYLPVVTSILPTSGTTVGGTDVTLTGTGLATVTNVSIGGVACTDVVAVNATTVTCTTGAHAVGLADVVVSDSAGGTDTGANLFTYAAPTITSISPVSGPSSGGTSVVVTGTYFAPGATVTVGGAACTVTTTIAVDDTSITCTTSAHASGFVDVVVTNTDNGTATGSLIFQYLPVVTSILPTSGTTVGGTDVTITGTGLATVTGATVGGVACLNVVAVNATTVTCTTGAGAAGTVDVVVTDSASGTGTGTSLFTYSDPTVTSIAPGSGPATGGTSVVITGAYFAPGATVMVGGAACPVTSTIAVDTTSITCTTGARTSGIVNVVVTNTDSGTATGSLLFQYLPVVTSILPASGTTVGGTDVTITGSGLASITSASIGGVACTSVVAVNDTTVTCTTGAHASGTVDVVVTDSASGTGTGAGLFTYTGPTVASIAPGTGPATGGTSVVVNGSYFAPGATVSIGGVTCTVTSTVDVDDTSITCTTGSRTSGTVDVVVTNTDSGSATGPVLFQYLPVVTGITPAEGSVLGGRPVTITGAGLSSITGATLGGIACTSVTAVDDTTVTCTTGAHPRGVVDVTVTDSYGGSGTGVGIYTYMAEPGAPRDVTANPANGMATISWRPPLDPGSSPVTSYVVTAYPGGRTCTVTAPATTCRIEGLTNGVAYTFTVQAFNSTGGGLLSPASTAVTPVRVPVPAPINPGRSQLLIDGIPTPVQVDPNAQTNGLDITGDGWVMTLQGMDDAGRALPLGRRGQLLLQEGGTVSSTGTEFKPASTVWLFMYPAAAAGRSTTTAAPRIAVGTLTVAADGTFAGVRALPRRVTPGNYVLQAVGEGRASEQRVISLGVSVIGKPGAAQNPRVTEVRPGAATVVWRRPAATGGSAIIGYIVTAWTVPQGTSAGSSTVTTGPATIKGLISGCLYRFSVQAVTAGGISPMAYTTMVQIPLRVRQPRGEISCPVQ